MVASSIFVNNEVQILPNPYALTIKPRLEYSSYLVDSILQKLEKAHGDTRDSNARSYVQTEGFQKNPQFKRNIESEACLDCAMEAILLVQRRLDSISQMDNIAEIASPLISIIRTVNSNIYLILPQVSQELVELSGLLGSIVMDSGSLAEAKFDFKQTNLESKRILAEVNLIVESKIRTSYPNLNF